MSKRFASIVLVALCVYPLHALLQAQAPHGGAGTSLQPGPNVNAAGGIVSPADPAALLKADILLQRQNETVVAASTRNADHIMAAANDYRFVDFPDDPDFGGAPSFITRLIAKLFRRPLGKPLPVRATGGPRGAWTGVYRSCDRGRTWIGSALPGGPLDNSAAAQLSPLKQLSLDAVAAGGHAETTDPFVMAGPRGRMHMVVLGFVRFPNGGVGDSRMYYASYTDRNNLEGGGCFNYDFTQEIDRGAAYGPAAFIDKPSMAVDKDGAIFISYTVFTDAINSRIVVARKLTDSAAWTRTIPNLNLGFLRNHGTTTTINPVDGTVYVAWRLFYDDWPLMVVSRSTNRGSSFSIATPISEWWPAKSLGQIIQQLKAARLRPFDQFNETPGGDPSRSTARSLGFPSITAAVVGGQPRLFAAWQERAEVKPSSKNFGQPSANGSPRIMFTMSTDGGWTWTARRAIDAGPRASLRPQDPGPRPSGPQVQPILSVSGTTNPELLVLYYEAREELATPHGSSFISGIERQMDVRAARINPSTGALLAPSVQVAEYSIEADSSPAALTQTAPGYSAVSRPNLWMYGGGTKAFFGDYPHLTSSAAFEADGDAWKWSSEPASALAIWTDHRDVQFPLNGIAGDWGAYTPITNPSLSSCSFVALRNANPYFAEIAGVVAGSPQNFKPLNIQRAFVTYVENRTPQDRFFRLTIVPDTGVEASFKQFETLLQSDVQIFRYSSRTQSIWVEPNANLAARVRMNVREITGPGGQVVAGGYRTSVTLNPDPNNDALTPVPAAAPVPPGTSTDITDSELHNPQVSAPQVSARSIKAPQVSAPQVSAPQVSAPQVSAPQVSAPQVSAPQVSAPQVSAPQVSATAPGEEANGTEVTYTVTNSGNTETTYDAFLNVPGAQALLTSGNYNFQVLVTRTSLVPGFLQTANGCVPAAQTKVQVLANIQIPNGSPQVSAILFSEAGENALATFSVAPAGGADVPSSTDSQSPVLRDEVKITLRAIRLKSLAEIAAVNGPVFNPATVEVAVASTSTNVVNGVVQADGTQPVATASTTILASSAPLAVLGAPLTLTATVSPAPQNLEQATVQFFDGTTLLGSALVDDGEATFVTSALSFAPHELRAHFVGSRSVGASTSPALTQHVLEHFTDLALFNAALAGQSFNVEDFNSQPTGTLISQLPPINGVINFTSSFATLQVFGGVPQPPTGALFGTNAFGLNGGSRQNGRYDLFFIQPGSALGFDIAAQDPATSPGQIEVLTGAGSAFVPAINTGPETTPVFHGFRATLAITGARVFEGCEVGEPVVPNCPNEETAIDNVRTVRDVRLWSSEAGGNDSYYEYVRVGGLSWTDAAAAAQARTFNGRTGRLASITSAAENAFADSLRDGGVLRAWIGLRDPDGTGAASWSWSSGEPFSYFNWSAGEPNNPTTEFWVEMFTGGQWNNNTILDPIYPTLGYIVEYPVPEIIIQ